MMVTEASTTSLMGQLVLVRLLTTGTKKLVKAEVRKSLESFFDQRKTSGEWKALLEEILGSLQGSGLITTKPLRLTEQGRQQALEFLGVEVLPPKADWRFLKKLLLGRALGLPGNSAESRKHLGDVGKLKGEVLRRHFGLPTKEFPTLNQALNALAWKQLNVDSDKKITIKAILAQVPGLPVADGKKWQEQIPAKIVGARNTRAEELRRALLCRWLEGDDQAPRSTFPIPAPTEQPAASPLAREPGGSFNLAGFAEAVLEAARSCTTGRFGDHKVFISHVWRQFQACNDFPGMDEPSFKERLAEANQAGLLALSRADLVEIMNPQDVQDSETRYLHATFHFVKI